jgi:hypothetical protein
VNWRTVIRWKQNGRDPMPKHIAALEQAFRDGEALEVRVSRLERELVQLRKRFSRALGPE